MSIKKLNKNKIKKKISKKRLVTLVVIVIIIITILLILGFTIFNKSWKEANDKYKIAYEIVYKKNIELDKLIDKSEKLVNSKNKALNEDLRDNLIDEIEKAKESKKELVIKPILTKKIIKEINKMNKVNYENTIEILMTLYDELDESIKKYKLVDNPTEEYVISRLKEIDDIYNITPYTEDTDGERYLGKPKRYYSKIVFQHEKVEHFGLENNLLTITEVGNPAGGCVELFKTVEDAENRNLEMKNLEGTNRSPGSHKVIGTILIRTSDDLTKSQQAELEEKIIEILTKLDDEVEKESKEESSLENKESSNVNDEKSTDKIVFYGGTTASSGWGGNGVLSIKNIFSSEDEINFTGKITGFTGKKYITLIQSFPNGDYFTDTFDVQSGDVIGFGYVDCGIGNGSFTVKLTETGEVLGYYEFIIQ